MNNEDLKKQLGHRIKVRRVDCRLKQEQLADQIGMNQGQLSQIERGLLGLSVSQLVAIARALDCGVSDLLEEVRKVA
ncbi:MAG: helix-turn-helix domain-containing protein [Candidatus Contendobacter sp.]|jgi:transcriptional regulator with XRE-family HTH domain|nr:helix-turn-helix transcriptional regulator [Gammaproteobacteria bacterium]MCC8995014.1 helix-turn-helix domain-containing protein [Candidatus Contendobacter sp.]